MQQSLTAQIDALNPQQKDAVLHKEGPVLILAGAGSGKTRVVTLRMAHLINEGVSPQNILGVTFTNKAAGEMRERSSRLVKTSGLIVSTFHSLGARILREDIHHLGYSPNFAIYDDDDTTRLMKQCIKDCEITLEFDVKVVKNFISRQKNALISPNDVHEKDDEDTKKLFVVYQHYAKQLKQNNAVDFDDLLYLPVQLFMHEKSVLERYQERWQYVLVDEYQDTNQAQYRFIRLISEKQQNLLVVGDPDQSIYSWRGANIQNILNFERDYPGAKIVRLEQNYRSTETILQAANAVIKNNNSRLSKNLWSSLGTGEKITVFLAPSERQEAEFVAGAIQFLKEKQKVPYNEVAVFYRTNAQSRALEDACLAEDIPYTIIGGVSFYVRKEVKDILSFLQLIANPWDQLALQRVINLPKRGLGEVFLQKVLTFWKTTALSLVDFFISVAERNGFHELGCSINKTQKAGWLAFSETLKMLQHLAKTASIREIVQACVFQTKYISVLDQDPETREERLENLSQLILKADEWDMTEEPTLRGFLETTLLSGSKETLGDDLERVHLMTVHNGKGLEYTAAFLVAVEEEIFPHIHSRDNPEQLEEERRLFYVGITRAKQHLFVTTSSSRSLWGGVRPMRPSRFLREIPDRLREKHTLRSWKSTFPDVPQEEERAALFRINDVVFHATFGIGRVEEVNSSESGTFYTILFMKEEIPKKILAANAPLQRLG